MLNCTDKKEMQIKSIIRNNFFLLILQKSRSWTAHSVARLQRRNIHILLLGSKWLTVPPPNNYTASFIIVIGAKPITRKGTWKKHP